MKHKPWLITLIESSAFNVNLSISNNIIDILYPRHSDRHPCRHRRSRHGQRPPQCVDANPGDEVVHDLDLDIRHWTGAPQILNLYDDMENCQRPPRYANDFDIPPESCVGLFLRHLHRRTAILLPRRGQLGDASCPRGQGTLRKYRCYDRLESYSYGDDDHHGHRMCDASWCAPLEDTDEVSG